MRLYLDANVDALAARRLRERGHDVVAASEVGLASASDADQLAFAAREGRTLLTFDIGDFVELYEQWWHDGRRHPGILVARAYRRAEPGTLLRRIEDVLERATERDPADRLRFLSEFEA